MKLRSKKCSICKIKEPNVTGFTSEFYSYVARTNSGKSSIAIKLYETNSGKSSIAIKLYDSCKPYTRGTSPSSPSLRGTTMERERAILSGWFRLASCYVAYFQTAVDAPKYGLREHNRTVNCDDKIC